MSSRYNYRRVRLLLGSLLVLLPCSSCSKPKQGSVSSDAVPDARTSEPPVAPMTGETLETREPIDLVLRAAASVVTSSHKDESSLAEFMLDGLKATAWQPNPPDPMPWVDVYFPSAIELSALTLQFKGRSPSAEPVGLRLTIDGNEAEPVALTGERVQLLQPTRARLVRLTFQHQKDEAALKVSSLSLWGHAPAREAWGEMVPESHVQGRATTEKLRGCASHSPFDSPEAACDSCTKELQGSGAEPYQDIQCNVGAPVRIEGQRPQTIREVRWIEVTYADQFDSYQDSFLALSTSGGWHLSALSSQTRIDVGSCPGMSDSGVVKPSLKWQEGLLTVEQVRWFYRGRMALDTASPEPPPPTSAVRALRVCKTQDQVLCREYVIAFGYPEANFVGDPEQPAADPVTGPPKTWAWERSYEIRQGGIVRFAPCRAGQQESSRVPCLAPGFSTFL